MTKSTSIKVFLAQINPTPLDFKGNLKQHLEALDKAEEENSELIVFPELSIPGYLCADAMHKTSFIQKNKEDLAELTQRTIGRNYYVVVGYVDRNTTGFGKPFRNMLAVIHNGQIIGTYQKWLLPYYDVFDEPRYFASGKDTLVLKIKGNRVGFTICEDLWNDKGQDDYNHKDNPIQTYRDLGVDILVNISSSPYARGKPAKRHAMLSEISRGFKAIVYVNQYGGMDELVFDGRSSIYLSGCLSAMIKPAVIPSETPMFGSSNLDVTRYFNEDWQSDHLKMALLGLYDYGRKCGFSDYVVGSSGGIDSAVVIAMAATVFDPKSVHCIRMPGPYSSDRSSREARLLHENLGTSDYERMITVDADIKTNELCLGLYDKNYNSVAKENIQARSRGQITMYMANALNMLTLTTGNKTEMAVGYCTLYGDMNGGFNPLVDVEKLQVYEFARLINKFYGSEVIPISIINAAPSAELAPDQTDEGSLMPYNILDYIVRFYVEEYVDEWNAFKEAYYRESRPLEVSEGLLNEREEEFYRMIRLIDIMEHKRRQATIGPRLTPKAFGVGRRLPIVKG